MLQPCHLTLAEIHVHNWISCRHWFLLYWLSPICDIQFVHIWSIDLSTPIVQPLTSLQYVAACMGTSLSSIAFIIIHMTNSCY